MSYSLVEVPVVINPKIITKKELDEYRMWFYASLNERLQELVSLVRQAPAFREWKADYTTESLTGLGKGLAAEAKARGLSESELVEARRNLLFDCAVNDVVPTYYTLSISFDAGIYLSQMFLKNCPSLEWHQMLTSKRDVDYGLISGKRAGQNLTTLYEKWKGMLCPNQVPLLN